jgi:N-terminal domain on NACHT_NTPase and P-loop NTPases
VRKDDGRFDRYKRAVGVLGKGSKVEGLMEEILKDAVACDKLRGTATKD